LITIVAAAAAVVVVLAGVGAVWAVTRGSSSTPGATKPSKAAMATVPAPPDEGPSSATGAFTYAAGPGQLYGTGGAVRHFRVAVENGSGQDPTAFAAAVDQIVADPRGWTANQGMKLQRVGQAATADFTIFLATPVTSEAMCAAGGLHTAQVASCYLPGKVIINLARWMAGVSDYGAPIAVYRQFAVNHEIGRFLGASLEGCPGAGRLAPVMMQQTLGLKGCKPNPWPYVDGAMYSGPKVP
jgi:hypothetical protein